MKSVDEMKKIAKGRTSMVVFAIIVVVVIAIIIVHVVINVIANALASIGYL